MKNMKPFYTIPRIKPIYSFYRGLDGGLGLMWLGKLFYIVKPINER